MVHVFTLVSRWMTWSYYSYYIISLCPILSLASTDWFYNCGWCFKRGEDRAIKRLGLYHGSKMDTSQWQLCVEWCLKIHKNKFIYFKRKITLISGLNFFWFVFSPKWWTFWLVRRLFIHCWPIFLSFPKDSSWELEWRDLHY